MELEFLKVNKIEIGDIALHCVQSPEEDEFVNAQIIETKNSLVLIDTMQLTPYSKELRKYVDSLKKPLKKIIITHYHPDHWMGTWCFEDKPLYALPEVIDKINGMYDFVIGFHSQRLGEKAAQLLPPKKVVPAMVMVEGTEIIDGLKINFKKITETESPVMLMAELPDLKVLLAQDIVYHKVYAYFGDRTSTGELCIDNWIETIKELQKKNYELVLPGHGLPTDSSVFPEMITYLEFAKQGYDSGLIGQDLVDSIIAKYPDYKLQLTLQMTSYMLFNQQN